MSGNDLSVGRFPVYSSGAISTAQVGGEKGPFRAFLPIADGTISFTTETGASISGAVFRGVTFQCVMDSVTCTVGGWLFR